MKDYRQDKYSRLHDVAPPEDEICRCADTHPIKLMSTLSNNPIHCLNCNLYVPPQTLNLSTDLVDAIVYWRTLHDSLFYLWLDSADYEDWAKAQLLDITGRVNVLGREVQDELNTLRRCYYWYFQDESADDYEPISQCPVCGDPLLEYNAGNFPQRICERCSIVTPGPRYVL